jgi:hypothetical protein
MTTSLKQSIPQYYYTITGDVVIGDNKSATEFTSYSESRFPINIQPGIFIQSEGWNAPFKGNILPFYESLEPGTIPAKFAVGRSTPRAVNQ